MTGHQDSDGCLVRTPGVGPHGNDFGGPVAAACGTAPRRSRVEIYAIVACILVLSTILRFWRLGELALAGDESYYWLWSLKLDWAYFDHPAGVAVMVWLSSQLPGLCSDTWPASTCEIGVRWLNASLGVGSTLLAYLVGSRMLTRQAGALAAFLVAVGAPFLVTSRLVYTDALQLFLVLLNLFWFWQLAQEQPRPHVSTAILFGVSLALLFNTKYNAYLYAGALLTVTLVDFPRLFKDKRAWLAGLIAATGLLPVLAWNALHDWASLRWQLEHLGLDMSGQSNLLSNLNHTVGYLTWPMVVLAGVGLLLFRNPAQRLLSLVALFLILPVALSPADSPRNLATGLVPLLLLAGTRWFTPLPKGILSWRALLLGMLMAAAAAYGIGTVLSLHGCSDCPRSTVVPEIRRDASGWRELAPLLLGYPEPVLTLDYSIASQIWFYSGRPAYTTWGQYQIWGLPDLSSATVISQDYLPVEQVSARLTTVYRAVEGPHYLRHTQEGIAKELRVWQAEGQRADNAALLERLDFLGLLGASR